MEARFGGERMQIALIDCDQYTEGGRSKVSSMNSLDRLPVDTRILTLRR
jgi:hypothetical protein